MHLSQIDLNLLVGLEALVKERNVTRAAKQVGLSQPAMSNVLRRLRNTFDDPILVRHGRNMVPTQRALHLVEHANEALRILESALRTTDFDPSTSQRVFRICVSDYTCDVLVRHWHADLRREAPGITIELHPPPAHGSLEPLERGSVDLLFGAFTNLRPPFHEVALFDETFAVVARADHPHMTQGGIDLETYLQLDHILVHPLGPGGGHGIVDTVLASMNHERNVPLHVSYFGTALHSVTTSDLVATLPKRFVDLHATDAHVVVEPPLDIPAFTIRLAWHTRDHADAGVAYLRQGIVDAAAAI